MNAHPERAEDYLQHIQTALARIRKYTQDVDFTGFIGNEIIQDAVIRNLEIIGEAARNIERDYPTFASQHPQLPLAEAYATRNWLSHGYFKINLEVIWQTIEIDLPELEAQVLQILADEFSGNQKGEE
jgi:uncharacterized protein with HEPN domain